MWASQSEAFLHIVLDFVIRVSVSCRCGNVAAILELDEHLNKSFKVTPSVKLSHTSNGSSVTGSSAL